jgi:co-chaperonin GroES (HSP10)
MSIRPLNNKVVVERIAAEKATSSGIILKHTDGPDRAKILAIGPEVTDVSVGEIALINWNAASKAEGETFVVSVDEIVFIYED